MKPIFLSLALLVSLAGCSGGGGDATPAATPAATSAPESNSATPRQPETSTAILGAEAAVETEAEPLTRYGVFELKIVVPGADKVTPTHLGDNRSVAGTWRRVVEAPELGDEVYPFVWHWGGKLDLGFEKLLPVNRPPTRFGMLLSHYNGRYLAGKLDFRTLVPACELIESYILDTKNDRLTPFTGVVLDLNKRGEVTGSLDVGGCNWPEQRAFYWDGEIFKRIPDDTLNSAGLRLRNGTVEGVGGYFEVPEWDTVFVWDLATDIVTHYLPGDPAGPSFEPDPLPDAATLHEQINEDDPWFGRLTFTLVRDVGPDGCILVEGCSSEGCGSFLLIPPQ